MSGYHLSILRRGGWIRVGMVGALAMVPITLMERALGYFSDGEQGLWQALEFLAGGIALWLIVGFLARWVVHGFAVRSKESDAGHDEATPTPAPRLPAGRTQPADRPPRH
jgi:hypothetical protein